MSVLIVTLKMSNHLYRIIRIGGAMEGFLFKGLSFGGWYYYVPTLERHNYNSRAACRDWIPGNKWRLRGSCCYELRTFARLSIVTIIFCPPSCVWRPYCNRENGAGFTITLRFTVFQLNSLERPVISWPRGPLLLIIRAPCDFAANDTEITYFSIKNKVLRFYALIV